MDKCSHLSFEHFQRKVNGSTRFREMSTTQSSHGAQVLSNKASGASFSIGKGQRLDPTGSSKQFISGELSKVSGMGNSSPGPIYDIPGCIGIPFVEGRSRSSPRYTISERPNSPKDQKIPGVGSYEEVNLSLFSGHKRAATPKIGSAASRTSELKTTEMGRLPMPGYDNPQTTGGNFGSTPATSLGYGDRWVVGLQKSFQKPRDYGEPGPGAFQVQGAFGPQVLSTKKSYGGSIFPKGGSSGRDDDLKKQLVERKFRVSSFGRQSKAHFYGEIVSSIGPQIESRKRSSRVSSFSKADRFGSMGTASPGPGSY